MTSRHPDSHGIVPPDGPPPARTQDEGWREPPLGLGAAYEDAWTPWVASGDSEAWEAVTADGLA
jgi:hypothetical protein